MKKQISLLAAIISLGMLAAADPAPDVAYSVNLVEKDTAGSVRDVHITLDQRVESNLLAPAKTPPMPPQVLQADLTGRLEVLKISNSGIATDLRLTVQKMVRPDGRELLKAGAVVDIHRTPEACTFKVTGGTLGSQAKNALDMIFPNLPHADEAQLVYGTKTARKVGEGWGISQEEAADMFARNSLKVSPKNITGKATFKAAETAAGIPALRYDLIVTGTGIQPEGEASVDSCTMTQAATLLQPIDPASPRLQADTTTDMDLRTTIAGRPLQTTVHVAIHFTSTPASATNVAGAGK